MANSHAELPRAAISAAQQREMLPISRVTLRHLKWRLHTLRLSATLQFVPLLPFSLSTAYRRSPLSANERWFLYRLNGRRLAFDVRCGSTVRKMMECPCCRLPVAGLTNDHVTRDCTVARQVLFRLADWLAGVLGPQVAPTLHRMWHWRDTPWRNPLSMACFVLCVMAKQHLHNASLRAFFTEREVTPAPILATLVRRQFVQRVITARKDEAELAGFNASSSVSSRFSGIRPPPPTNTGAPWHQCFTPAQLQSSYPSLNTPIVDVWRSVMVTLNDNVS